MTEPGLATLTASRRRLIGDVIGIAASAVAFGFVYGLAAQRAGLSPVHVAAMSVLVFAGAAQFAAVGYLVGGVALPGILVLTGLLNARHILYSAALAPWLREVPFVRRAVMAHLLTDETFALSIAHFTRIGRTDERGYWIAAIGGDFIPWTLATIAGSIVGREIPSPERFGLDIVFPAAMAGLAVGLVTGRREVVAAIVGALLGVVVGLAVAPSVGIVAGGILGPIAGMLTPRGARGAHDAGRASDVAESDALRSAGRGDPPGAGGDAS